MQTNDFVIKNCVQIDLKQKRKILLSQFYYEVCKNKGSIFFQSVCEAAILHITFVFILGQTERPAASFSCCGKEEKADVWDKLINDGVEASTRNLRFVFRLFVLCEAQPQHDHRTINLS